MILASSLRPGMAIKFENRPYRVLLADYHAGQGKMSGTMHARLKDLGTGTVWEHSFRSDLKLEDLTVERRTLTFLYKDGEQEWFMDPETFDQTSIPDSLIGESARFLKPDMQLFAEFVEEHPIGLQFPDILEITVADTAPPIKQQADSTWKPAHLENGIDVMVPPFIKTGDVIRLDVEHLKYIDRVKALGR